MSSANGVPPMWGEYVAHSHTSRKNLINALICLCVLAPSIVATWAAYSRCSPDGHATATLAEAACSCAMVYPIAFANLLFFLNVSLLFWLIGLAQRSLCEPALKTTHLARHHLTCLCDRTAGSSTRTGRSSLRY